jgi:hypothetical protein
MSVKTLLRCVATVLVVASLLPSMACMGKIQQAAQKQKERNDLMQIGLMYHNYYNINKSKPPATLDDLLKFGQQNDPAAAPVMNDLQSGKYVIYLGVDVMKLPDGSTNTVLGYESNVPTAGGPVLMADGAVRDMTPADFAAAKKPANAKLSKP